VPFPILVHPQQQNETGIYVNLAARRWAHEYDVVASDNDRANLLGIVWIRYVVSVFKDKVHVLIIAVEFSPDGSAALQLDQDYLAQAFLEDLRGDIGRHAVVFSG